MEQIRKIFSTTFSQFLTFPVVKADDEEDLVDPQDVLREECGKSVCSAFQKKYQKCNERVNSKTKTTETCQEELFDFMYCVDHCAAKTLFSKLK